MGVGAVNRLDVYLAALDPTRRSEIRKTRLRLDISPDEMNRYIRTAIVAPMASKGRDYPTRVPCAFRGMTSQVVLDQMRTVDKVILINSMGRIENQTQARVLHGLSELLAPWGADMTIGSRRRAPGATLSQVQTSARASTEPLDGRVGSPARVRVSLIAQGVPR